MRNEISFQQIIALRNRFNSEVFQPLQIAAKGVGEEKEIAQLLNPSLSGDKPKNPYS